jgi:hypothetical protein
MASGRAVQVQWRGGFAGVQTEEGTRPARRPHSPLAPPAHTHTHKPKIEDSGVRTQTDPRGTKEAHLHVVPRSNATDIGGRGRCFDGDTVADLLLNLLGVRLFVTDLLDVKLLVTLRLGVMLLLSERVGVMLFVTEIVGVMLFVTEIVGVMLLDTEMDRVTLLVGVRDGVTLRVRERDGVTLRVRVRVRDAVAAAATSTTAATATSSNNIHAMVRALAMASHSGIEHSDSTRGTETARPQNFVPTVSLIIAGFTHQNRSGLD